MTRANARGRVYCYVTCDRITAESAEFGDAAERGWVDDVGDRAIEESRNYVKPIMAEYPPDSVLCDDPDEFGERVREAVASLGAYETSDGSTFYGVDSHADYVTGDDYTYAIHFSRSEHPLSPGAEVPFDVSAWLT